MKHYVAHFPGEGHTITQLARHVARVDPVGELEVIDSGWVKEFADTRNPHLVPRVEIEPNSLVHIGNNPHSLPLLMALRQSRDHIGVILHDLWIFDLLTYLEPIEEQEKLPSRLIFNSLHAEGLRSLAALVSGGELSSRERGRLLGSLLNWALPPNAHVIHHGLGQTSAFAISEAQCHAFAHVWLPDFYCGALTPIAGMTKHWDVVISGTGSYGKRPLVMTAALAELLSREPLRVAVGGAISGQFEKLAGTVQSSGGAISLYPFLGPVDWDILHSQSRVGIRVGVGALGESSGLVRDYLAYGLVVVTDDPTPISDHPRVVKVEAECSASALAEGISKALSLAAKGINSEPTKIPSGVDQYFAAVSASFRDCNFPDPRNHD